ncbi:MAG: hypothetical protein H0X27_02665 [Caulobacteraceae bacterium]|nr:hypothetical protein [Caulobacteraceae bacterium]
MPIGRFLVLCSARTGSTLLTNVLNASPDVRCLFELLNPSVQQYGEPATPELRDLRQTDAAAFVDRISGWGTKPVFGFKIFPGHADDWLEAALDDPSWKKIVLYRENVLAVWSSQRIAAARGKWSDTGAKVEIASDNADHVIEDQTEFIARKFESFRLRYQAPYSKWLARLADTSQKFSFLEYGMLRNPRIISSVFGFLDSRQPQSYASNIVKTSSTDILSRLTNVDEVRSYLSEIARLDWQAESFLEL